MRRATTQLAPLAVLLSSLASAQGVSEKPAQTGAGTGIVSPVPTVNTPTTMSPGSTGSGAIMQGSMSGATPVAAPIIDELKGSPVSAVGTGVSASVPRANANTPSSAAKRPTSSIPKSVRPDRASAVLGGAGREIQENSLIEEKTGADGLVREALNKAFDAAMVKGAAHAGVSGRFQTAREKVSAMVSIANKALPADAPDLYSSAIKMAKEDLPASAFKPVAKTVLSFAAVKAETSLTSLVSEAFKTAGKADYYVKALRKWETLLGAPDRPLLSMANGQSIERALADAAKTPGAATLVRVEKRGGAYVAILPGPAVVKIPGLAASFKLIQRDALSVLTRADVYRDFAAASGISGGAVYSARRAFGDSVPSAALTAGSFWLKPLFMRAWNALLSFLPGRSLPVVANAASLPRLRQAARSWRQAVDLGDAAASRAGAPRVTVSKARGAFALARRAALAHEELTATSGAASRIEALRQEFETGVARAGLTPADLLTPGLDALVSGEGGLRYWALLHAADARSYAATSFAKIQGVEPIVILGQGPGANAARDLSAGLKPGSMRFVASGSGLWASGFGSHGQGILAADLRSTEKGGSVRVDVERGDEALARALDGLGFTVARAGQGFRATVDAQSVPADAEELAALAAEAAALIIDSPPQAEPASADIEALLSTMRKNPSKAADAAKDLDGRAWRSRARIIGRIGELEAVASRIGKLQFLVLVDPERGLPMFASRIELLGPR